MVISALFIGAGLLQLSGVAPVRRAYARWQYPDWFRITIALIEIEAGMLAAFDTTQRVAALQLIPVMAGAVYTHGKTCGERHMMALPAFTGMLLARMARSRH
jgi:DoxX-like family